MTMTKTTAPAVAALVLGAAMAFGSPGLPAWAENDKDYDDDGVLWNEGGYQIECYGSACDADDEDEADTADAEDEADVGTDEADEAEITAEEAYQAPEGWRAGRHPTATE